MPDISWKSQASCIGLVDEFDYNYDESREVIGDERLLRKICNSCPVIDQCLADTLYYSDEYTFRAGMTPKERKILMKTLGIPSWEKKQEIARRNKQRPELNHGAGSYRWSRGCNCDKCNLYPPIRKGKNNADSVDSVESDTNN